LAKLVFLLNSFEEVVTHRYFFTYSCRDVLFPDESEYLPSFFESCGFAFADHPGQQFAVSLYYFGVPSSPPPAIIFNYIKFTPLENPGIYPVG
jgi:hypothetical protein